MMLRGEYAQAGSVFEEGATLAQDAEEKAQIIGKLAELSRKRGDMESAIQDYETALRTLGNHVPRSRFEFSVQLMKELLVQLLHTCLPRLFVHRLPDEPCSSERLSLRLFSGLAHAYYYGRGKMLVLWAHLRGLNLAEQYPPTPELANVYSEHAPVMALLTLFQRAYRYATKSYDIRKELGDLWGQGQSLHYHGCALYAASKFDECIAKCREAVRLLEGTGDFWQVHIARYQIAASYYHLGEFESAIAEAKKNHESGLALGDEQASGINLEVWARACEGQIAENIVSTEVSRERTDAQGRCQVLLADAIVPSTATTLTKRFKRCKKLFKSPMKQASPIAIRFPP